MIFTCCTYTGREAEHFHLANFCFPDDQLETELAKLSDEILGNSWYANQVCKRVLNRNRRVAAARSPFSRDVQA
jgi:enoyl-CoA hydratase